MTHSIITSTDENDSSKKQKLCHSQYMDACDLDLQKSNLHIGIIGFGDMGKLYAKTFVKNGWKNVNVCDLPSNYESLKRDFCDSGINVMRDGFQVSRVSDFLIYSVEASLIEQVVGLYGPSTKVGATVGAQTSVKEPEIKAFEKHLPPDVSIVTCHSLHGPNVNPKGLPLTSK